MSNYSVLLYYCYTTINNPDAFREEHHLFCLENNLKGRIIIAREGLNGTVSGLTEDCERYMQYIKDDERFATIDFKVEKYHKNAFEKLHVRVKDEIVNLGMPELNPNEQTGTYIEPDEMAAILDEKDVVLLDVRSDYEHMVGKFKNAITLDIQNFRDFPEKINELESLKDKKIITYCTGGIKCEKASALLLKNGFKQVYQLHGGIIKYGLEEGGKDFEGKCYVFDSRIVADVNTVNPTVIAGCHLCGNACDRMVNCANPECNKHVPICESCGEKYAGACSEECLQHPKMRAYNGTGYYQKKMNGYNPYKGLHRKHSKKEKQVPPSQI